VLERTRSATAPGGGGVEGDEVEFVRGAGVKVELDGYAGLAEAQGVGEVFVAEHLELGDLDVGGRTPGRVGDAGQGGVAGGLRAASGPVSRRSPDSARLRRLRRPRIQPPGQARGRDWPACWPVTR
jgi:hypothetical protein